MPELLVSGYGVMTRGLLPHLARLPGWSVALHSRHLDASPLPGVRLVDEASLGQERPDVVLGCFETQERSREFWLDPALDGLWGGGTAAIELSTLGHAWVLEWHAALGARGVTTVECPVTGSRPGAEAASLSLFVHASGPHPQAAEVLDAIGQRRYDFSEPGRATLFKLVYNAWGASILDTVSAYLPPMLDLMADDFPTARRVLEGDGWMSLVCASKLDRALGGDFSDPDFALGHMTKDLDYAREVIASSTLDLVHAHFHGAVDRHGPSVDYTAVTAAPTAAPTAALTES